MARCCGHPVAPGARRFGFTPVAMLSWLGAGLWLAAKLLGCCGARFGAHWGSLGPGVPRFPRAKGLAPCGAGGSALNIFGGELWSESPADVTTACAMGTGGLLGTRPAGGTRPRRGSAPLTHPTLLPSSVRAAPHPVRAPSGGRKGSACTPAAAASFLGASELLEEGLMSP